MRRRRVHHKLVRNRIYRNISEGFLYVFYYICPICILVLGLVATYNLLVCYGFDHSTGMWNINDAFIAGGVGLLSTIVLTFFSNKLLQYIVDKLYK